MFDRRRREGAADTGEGVAFDEETFVVDDLRAAGHAGGGEQRVDWRGDHRCKTARELALISGVANLGQGSAKCAGRRRGGGADHEVQRGDGGPGDSGRKVGAAPIRGRRGGSGGERARSDCTVQRKGGTHGVRSIPPRS